MMYINQNVLLKLNTAKQKMVKQTEVNTTALQSLPMSTWKKKQTKKTVQFLSNKEF